MGLGSGEMLFRCDLDSPLGTGILSRLTRDATPGTADATPLGAFVNCVKDCRSIAELKAKCSALT
ncbi:MAG: hypothetical protein ACREKG_04800 [Candidatus Rokuibacteriota bacterium]